MTTSKANHQKVVSSLSAEREDILEQFKYIGHGDVIRRAVKRGTAQTSENRKLSFYDRRDRNQLNDF